MKPKTIKIDANIDWQLLREQKRSLIWACGKAEAAGNCRKHELLEGLLALIDSIQDDASEQLPGGEQLVFGETS